MLRIVHEPHAALPVEGVYCRFMRRLYFPVVLAASDFFHEERLMPNFMGNNLLEPSASVIRLSDDTSQDFLSPRIHAFPTH